MISIAYSNIKKDLLGQPLQLLSGVDILGNASSALGHMSKGVAALSMDKKFIQGRQRQVSYKIYISHCWIATIQITRIPNFVLLRKLISSILQSLEMKSVK